MRSRLFSSLPFALLSFAVAVACSGPETSDGIDSDSGHGGASSGTGGGNPNASGGHPGDGGAPGSGGTGGPHLPGFDEDRDDIASGAVPARSSPCSGATNGTATLGQVWLAQTHVMEPSSADWTTNDAGATLLTEAQRPRFRLVSHRPALLQVAVTGSGTSPQVRVVATRDGSELGALCLAGPSSLPGSITSAPQLDDRFTVSLPGEWIRPGLELTISAGGATKSVPAAQLRVAGGLEHTIVEVPLLLFGSTSATVQEPRYAEELYATTPVSRLRWDRFPVDVPVDPVVLSNGSVVTERSQIVDGFDTIRVAIETARVLSSANGMEREAKFYGSLDIAAGGGLGGGDAAGGDASPGIFHHELGHTYGLPHLGDWYAALRYPFNKGSNAGGGSVGPHFAYDQLTEDFLTPFTSGTTEKQDPMQGGSGSQQDGRAIMFFSTYSAQAIIDHLQERVFFDESRSKYRDWDAASGDFVDVPDSEVNVFSGLPVERDVPVYTIHGTFWLDHPEANSLQPLLHYRGHLRKNIEVSRQADLDWLQNNPNQVCYWGCDYTFRVTYDDDSVRAFAIQLDTKDYMRRFGINIAADKALKKVEVFHRRLRNGGSASDAVHVSQTSASTYLDGFEPFATWESQ